MACNEEEHKLQPKIEHDFKLVILGDQGVGKTTFVKSHKREEIIMRYIPTDIGLEIFKIPFNTNIGKITFNIWDSYRPDYRISKGFYLNTDCAIIMYDLTSNITFKNVLKWYKTLTQICGNIPICIIGNKLDLRKRKFNKFTFLRKKGLQYYEISAKFSHNIGKPFIWLINRLFM